MKAKARQVWYRQLAELQNLKRLPRRIEVAIHLVSQKNEKWNLGMMFAERIRQNTGQTQMPLRRNGRRHYFAHGKWRCENDPLRQTAIFSPRASAACSCHRTRDSAARRRAWD